MKQKVKVKIDEIEKEAELRTFKSGRKGYGWYGTISIDGETYRVSLNIIKI